MAGKKYLLILVLVLVFGVMGCGPGGDDGGIIYLGYTWNFYHDDKYVGVFLVTVTGTGRPSAEAQLNAFRAVTAADVTFAPDNIVARTEFEHTEFNFGGIMEPLIKIPVTLLKTGTFEVTLRNKNGFSYKSIGYDGIFTVTEDQLEEY